MSAPQQRAELQAALLLKDICHGVYPRGKSKKLWQNRGKTKYLRFELAGHYRLVVVQRGGKVVFSWTGSHESYNSLLSRLRHHRF